IVVTSNPVAYYVTGPAGAVTDSDTPIVLTATNKRSGAVYTANAASNGSFSILVDGLFGDTFSLQATDSHPHPLSSQVIDVNGQITNINSVTTVGVQPSTVTGGAAATGTVRLAYPAHQTATVTLSSSSATATVPSSVTVPVNASTAQFTVNTTSPAASANVSITAAYGTSSQSATLTVLPAGAVLT